MDNIVAFYRINIYDWIDLTFKLLGMDRYLSFRELININYLYKMGASLTPIRHNNLLMKN